MSLGLIAPIVLVVLLIGVAPTWHVSTGKAPSTAASLRAAP